MTAFRPIVLFNRSQDEIKEESESDLEVSVITSEAKKTKDMADSFFTLLHNLCKCKHTFNVEDLLKTLNLTSEQKKQLKITWMSLRMYDMYKKQHNDHDTDSIWDEVMKSEENETNIWITDETFKEKLTEEDIDEKVEERLENEIDERVEERMDKKFEDAVNKEVEERIKELTVNKKINITDRLNTLEKSNAEYVYEKDDKSFDADIYGKLAFDNDILTSQRCFLTYSGKLDRKNITSFLETIGFPSNNTIVAYDTGTNKKILTRVYVDLRFNNTSINSTVSAPNSNSTENKIGSINKQSRTLKVGKVIKDAFDFDNKHPSVRLLNRVIMERTVKNYLNRLNIANIQ